MKPERVCEIFLRFQPPNTITTHVHSSKIITRFPFYSPSSSQPRLIILFLLNKLVGTSIIKIKLKIMSREKEEVLIIRIRLLKRRGRKVKVHSLFGGQWKEKEKVLFYLFPLFPLSNFTYTFIFYPLTLRFYFTMVLGHYLCMPFLFLGL
jgi:hypothetical protein